MYGIEDTETMEQTLWNDAMGAAVKVEPENESVVR
jgi:hypothetical protein